MQGKFSNIERDARGVVSNLDLTITEKLNSALLLKSMGNEEGAIKMVAHTVKVYLSRYPEIEVNDRFQAEAPVILLSFTDSSFKKKVRDEVLRNGDDLIPHDTLDQLLNTWMPHTNSRS